jgi:hypothetical protein
MARMFPDECREFHTDGEEHFYRFVEAVAKPDEQYLCWYLPDIKGVEPDFLLFNRDVGLVVFEVKDWSLEQIRQADPHSFLLTIGSKEEKRKNPLKQAEGYCFKIIDKIRQDGRLLSDDPLYAGKPKIPVICGVVFPNINKHNYVQEGLDKVLPTNNVFFWDDLHPMSDICSDKTNSRFAKALSSMFPPLFKFSISERELDHLRRVIFPVVILGAPRGVQDREYVSQKERLLQLDRNQEALARRFDSGHHIIKGPSGSGKTLVLVHKAAMLLRYNPKIKSILFVCYNITLVNYIQHLLSEKSVPLGRTGVEVLHFFDLCSKVLGEDVPFEKEDSDYYDLVTSEAGERAAGSDLKYDAVLVDEGQDFSDQMLKVVMGVLNPETDNLTIALDENQVLYQRKRSWKGLGVSAAGRVQKLPAVYRNTTEITSLADKFIGRDPKKEFDSSQYQLLPDTIGYHGPSPELCAFDTPETLMEFMADKVHWLSTDKEYPLCEIAALYTTSRPILEGSTARVPSVIQSALELKGIMSNWASEDYRAKRGYDVTTEKVCVSTIHSVKGLDFASVFLLGLEFLEPGERWTQEQIDNLVYVAMTRARYRLYIPYLKETDLIARLKDALKKGVSSR